MSMAQDNRRSVRSEEPYSHDPATAGPQNDPLAELARLIGQEDPFANDGRQGGRRGSPPQAPAASPDAPDWRNRSAPAPQHDPYAYDDGAGQQHHDTAY